MSKFPSLYNRKQQIGENQSHRHQNYEGSGVHVIGEEDEKAGFVQLGEKKANEGSDFSLQLPKVHYGEDEVGLFLAVHSGKTKCSGHKLQQGKFMLAASREYSS